MNYVSWRLQTIPSLVHNIISSRRFLSILCQIIKDSIAYTDVIEEIYIYI